MLLFVDKPSGITSFDVIRRLRQELGIRKIGHAGTLDPLATGLLILATEKDTKKLTEFLKLDKEYEVEIEFGKVSDTYDVDGKVEIQTSVSEICEKLTREKLDELLRHFVGEIEQTPPKFSAIKIRGKPAYTYSRRGEVVTLSKRKIKIFAIEILEVQPPFVKLRVKCGSGTYIRSLVHDLGQKLCVGAVVKGLRRTKVGPYDVEGVRVVE